VEGCNLLAQMASPPLLAAAGPAIFKASLEMLQSHPISPAVACASLAAMRAALRGLPSPTIDV